MLHRHHLSIFIALTLMLSAFGPVLATEPAGPVQEPDEIPADSTIGSNVSANTAGSAIAAEIADIMAREQEQVAQLSARIAAAKDETEVMNLQRQVHLIKIRAERDMLALQLPAAREKSAPEKVDRLVAAIEALDEMARDMNQRITTEVEAAGSRN